ncbi:MAG: tRNA (guanosine(37)-N1)-methyltransferase TrmD [Clostridia bacterium]|nr:tRNA (guanosine(37)-N1)-methyltransferase TrmD [Clostridia bacterium]
MKIEVLTLFPEMYAAMQAGVIGRALAKDTFCLDVINIRDFSEDKHKKTDDYPFGGGVGMVMTPQPIHSAILARDPEHRYKRIYLSPKGKKLTQSLVRELAKEEYLMFLCGSYEGVDERVIALDIDTEISIGDYILTSGDLAAMVVINAVARNIEGVLGSEESTTEESFSDNYLEYPHYTRPQSFCGLEVPEVLISGNHKKIDEWRKAKQLEITRERRPDLLK